VTRITRKFVYSRAAIPLPPSHYPPPFLAFFSRRIPLVPFPFPAHPLSTHPLSLYSLYSLSRTLSLSLSFPLTLPPFLSSSSPLSHPLLFLHLSRTGTVSVTQRNLYVCPKRLLIVHPGPLVVHSGPLISEKFCHLKKKLELRAEIGYGRR
jgi:hypothetical protein